MKRPLPFLFLSFLLWSCGESKTTPTPSPTPSGGNSALPAPPIPGDDKFPEGFCEYTKNGEAPQKSGGSRAYLFTSTHWGDSFTARPFKLSCGSFDFLSSGGPEEFPMKPGKIKVAPNGGPGTIYTEMRLKDSEGEVNIETWDAKQIKGTFSVKGKGTIGSDADKDLSLSGSFDIKFSGKTF